MPHVVVQHLGHGRQAVGRAGGAGDERLALVALVVHAHHEHRSVVLGRSGHDDRLRAGLDVAFGLRLLEEEAGRFANVLGADIAPLQVGRILLRGQADFLAVDDQTAVAGFDGALERAVNAVILQHVRKLLRVEQVVDADHFDLGVLHRRPEHQPADSAETVNTNFDCHGMSSRVSYSIFYALAVQPRKKHRHPS